MDEPRLTEGSPHIKAGSTILSLEKGKKIHPIKAAFYWFLIAFFCCCVWVTVIRLFPEGRMTAALSELLLSWGL